MQHDRKRMLERHLMMMNLGRTSLPENILGVCEEHLSLLHTVVYAAVTIIIIMFEVKDRPE